MAQNISLMNATYSNVPAVVLPKQGGGTARFDDCTVTTATASDVASGKVFIASDGTITTGTASGGGGKNIQVNSGAASIHTNTYTSTGISITVAKSGTYKISWMAARSSTSGTQGTRLRRNNTDGTVQTTWSNNYAQHVTLNNQTLSANDVITIYANSSSNSRYIWAGNLIIEEQ